MNDETKKIKGGKRPGAGRKSGSTTSLEKTIVVRIPVSQKPVVSDLMAAYAKKRQASQLKQNLDQVSNFALPAAADDHIEDRLDPNAYLIDQADTTFFVTIQGESMVEAGLIPGDKAVVDRGKQAVVGDIVLAMIDGEFTIKILAKQKNGNPKLLPANASGKYTPILIEPPMQFEVWGVVTGSFRRFR
jgi:DNA polymerase V